MPGAFSGAGCVAGAGGVVVVGVGVGSVAEAVVGGVLFAFAAAGSFFNFP